MYRMYIEFCGKENITPVKKYLYENIFNYEFNIAFFSPKKDQCSTCEEYKNTITKTVELEEKFEKHIKNKEDARNEIIKDTDTIKTNNNNGLYYYDYKPCYLHLQEKYIVFIINVDWPHIILQYLSQIVMKDTVLFGTKV